MTSPSRRGSPVSLCTKTVIGTPHSRWRETHQSGRVSIIARIRFWPIAGTQCVSSIAASATSRKLLVSMLMNHCGVLRKITGFLERQLWG